MAIQAALNEVPTLGGAVYFPPGDYLVSGPLAPKSRTLISGSHIPRWQGLVNPESACKIRMSGGFTGTGLIVPAGSTVAVKLRNLALVGNDVSQLGPSWPVDAGHVRRGWGGIVGTGRRDHRRLQR